jgi:hypothetical protein
MSWIKRTYKKHKEGFYLILTIIILFMAGHIKSSSDDIKLIDKLEIKSVYINGEQNFLFLIKSEKGEVHNLFKIVLSGEEKADFLYDVKEGEEEWISYSLRDDRYYSQLKIHLRDENSIEGGGFFVPKGESGRVNPLK